MLTQPKEAPLSQETKRYLAMQICRQDIQLHNRVGPSVPPKAGARGVPEEVDYWYPLYRSRIFQLIRVLGISDDVIRDAYWEVLSTGDRISGDRSFVAWFWPEESEQRKLCVETFMKGAI